MLAICEGPISDILRIWKDKEITDMATDGLTLLNDLPGVTWAYLTSNHPTQAIPYGGTTIAASASLSLGDSASLPNYNFEVEGFYSSDVDANANDVITHVLSTWIDYNWTRRLDSSNTTNYAQYCYIAGFGISPVLNEQRAAVDWLKEWLIATNSEAVWSSSTAGDGRMALKFLPYGDVTITNELGTWEPNTTPIYDLTRDDFLVDSPGDNPIEVTRISLADTFNSFPIQFRDRSIDYNDNTVTDQDQNDVYSFGERRKGVESLPCITRSEHALQISRILSQRSTYVRNKYRFKVGWKYILLDPMDLVTITEPLLGLDQKIVRIKSIEEDEYNGLTIEAEEWPFGAGTGTLYTTEEGDPGGQPTHNDPPGDIETPLIIDVPVNYRLVNGQPELMIGAAGLSTLWGGCEIWVSEDNATYQKIGRLDGPARIGVLTDTLPVGDTIDLVNTLSVDLTESDGALTSTSYDNMIDSVTLSYCGGEFLDYQTATLTGSNAYDLTTLRRGDYGTTISEHLAGERFARLDSAFMRYTLPASRIGTTLYFKFPSYNVYGNGLQSLGDVSAYTYAPQAQSAPAPYNVTLESKLSGLGYYGVTVEWDFPSSTGDPDYFEIVVHTGTDPEDPDALVTSAQAPGDQRVVFAPINTGTAVSSCRASVRAVWT
jgi:hypothetical protein